MEITIFILAIIFLTLSSGCLSGSEAALFSLSTIKINSYRSDQNPVKRLVAALLHQPRDLLVTVFMLNTLVNILLQNVTSHLVGEAAGWDLKVGVPLVLTLVFGEIIPKYIGLQNNTYVACHVAKTINFLQNAIKPVRKIVIALTAPLSRVIFFFLKKEPDISKEEMQHVLKTSEEHGIMNADEAELVCGYLRLQDTLVKELMRPREDILFYDIHDPLTKLTYLFVDQECSRIPVCDDDLDNIIGIITAKQFFLHRQDFSSGSDLSKSKILRKPFYVPESTPARLLLRRFDEKRQVLAIIVDEYGSISGLIAFEDLVEVVTGEITDRRDQTSLYTKSGKNEIIASGKLELAEFNDIFDVMLDSPSNMVTIGGWLIEKFGDIPKSGTKYESDNFLFQVLSATPNRILRLYIRKLCNERQEKKPH